MGLGGRGTAGRGGAAWLLDAANPEWESALENGVRGCVAWKVGGAGGGWTGLGRRSAVAVLILGQVTRGWGGPRGRRRRGGGGRIPGTSDAEWLARNTPLSACLLPACSHPACLLACVSIHATLPGRASAKRYPANWLILRARAERGNSTECESSGPPVSFLSSHLLLLPRCHLRPSPGRSKGIGHSSPGHLARPFLPQFLPHGANSRHSASTFLFRSPFCLRRDEGTRDATRVNRTAALPASLPERASSAYQALTTCQARRRRLTVVYIIFPGRRLLKRERYRRDVIGTIAKYA